MAISPVAISFSVQNVAAVQKAIKSISDTLIQAENRSTSEVRKGSSERERSVIKEAHAKAQAWQRSEAVAESARRAGVRSVQQAAQAEARASQQAFNERIRMLHRLQVEERRIRAESLRDAITKSGITGISHPTSPQSRQAILDKAKTGTVVEQRAALDHVKDLGVEARVHQQAAREKIAAMKVADREAQKARDAGLREADKAKRAEVRSFEQGEREKNRAAAKWVREREAEERRADAAALARRKQLAATITGAAGKAVHSAAGVAGGAAKAAAGTFSQLGGGFSVADSIQQQADLERQSVMFSNSAFLGTPGEKRLSPQEIQAQTKASAIRTGINPDELLKGAAGYGAKTGAYKEGLDLQEFFGQVSKGTGASVEDVAKTAGQLRVQNKGLQSDQMKQLILDTVRQGQLGSVEFSDLAKIAGKVTRTSSAYAGDQTKNQGKLLGLAQIAMRTSGSPEEAATVLSNISADAGKSSKKLTAALGKDTFNERGQITKAPEEFIADVMEKTGGNLQKIQALGFGQRSMKMFQAIAPTFNEASAEALSKNPKDAKAASAAGRKAVLSDIREVTGGSMNVEELQANVKNVLNTSAEQFEASMRILRVEVGEKLLPELIKLVPVLQKLMPTITELLQGLVKVANWASSNPFEGFAALVTGFFVKELVAAKIGDTIKSLLSGGGGAGGGAGAAGGGALTGGLIGAGIAAQVGMGSNFADETYGAVKEGKASAARLTADINSGDHAKVAAARAEFDQAKAKTGTVDTAAAYVDRAVKGASIAINPMAYVGQKAGDLLSEKIGGTSTGKQAVETLKANEIVDAPELKEAISKAIREGVADGVKGSGLSAADPNNPNRFGPVINRASK